MGRQAFIFSLDAFVAFTLTMITINLLIFTIGTPKPFYPSLEQAHELAHDTLQALATSTDNPAQGSYLEQIISGSGRTPTILMQVAGGDPSFSGIIPPGYGYRLETYEFNATGAEGAHGWNVLFDAGTDGCIQHPVSDRCGKNFTKLSASATTFASYYTVPARPGESPYCYLSCFGYPGPHGENNPCNVTPCAEATSNFNAGQNSIRIIRLVVYT